MLACLPAASGDLTNRLLSHSQMNTGLQKWETTQKMRSANYPTPAELDAYAKKVANHPLTIKIFPNSIKVPQRKHVRRTVNGLDTSASSQRHNPYQSQVSTRAGLLAVLRAPAKGVIKDSDGSRARSLPRSAMNPQSGPYTAQSTLNLPQSVPHLQSFPQTQSQAMATQKLGLPHPQALQQQSIPHPMTVQQLPQTMPPHPPPQQRSMAHSQALQRQQSLSGLQTFQQQQQQQQSLVRPPGVQRQQSLPLTQTFLQQQEPQQQGPPRPPAMQHRPRPQALQGQVLPHGQALLPQQAMTQDPRHMADCARPPGLQLPQGLPPSQPLAQATLAAPPATPGTLQQQALPGAYGPRKLPDADAPPNVTVSTSTIPLSMAAGLHQNRAGDLSSIVHQINQFCQARAGMGATSVCEGQIANPSPINRNLLINASSRVHNPHSLGARPAFLMGGPPDKAPAQAAPQPNVGNINGIPAFHAEMEQQQQMQQQLQKQLQQQQQQQQLQQQHHHHHQQQMQQQQQLQQQQQQLQHQRAQQQLQHQQQQQRSWTQHQLAHMQQAPEGAHPCKNPRRDEDFPSRTVSYPHKLPSAGQAFPLKHPGDKPTPSPSTNPLGPMLYANGHYMQAPWANNNGSGPSDGPVHFQGGQAGASLDCAPRSQYRPGARGPSSQAKLMQGAEFVGGDFQSTGFREQNLAPVGKMHRHPMGGAPEPSVERNAHHQGY